MTTYEKTKTDVVPIVPMPDLGQGRPCLVVIRGCCAGELHWVQDGAVLGRDSQAEIFIADDVVSRHQCSFRVEPDDSVWLEDLGSTNGTVVEGKPVAEPLRLEDGDRLQLGHGTVIKFTYHDELEAAFQTRMYDAALRDPLTGLYNRRYLGECLESELAFARRHGAALTVCMLDLDHFKRINDEHGHEVGDRILAEMGERIRATVRKEDTCVRFGGEEFVVVSLGITLASGLVLAERLRGAVQARAFGSNGDALPLTVSVGVAGFPYPTIETPEALLSAADQALYLAKRRGRNRCKVFVTE